VPLREKGLAVSCGWEHTAVVVENGSLYTWGNGKFGCLGVGSTETQWAPVKVPTRSNSRVDSVSCGSRHTMFTVSDPNSEGKLYAIGEGEAGQLGTGRRSKETLPVHIPTSESVRQTSCGISHTAFCTVSGHVYTMGGNTFGQLGLNTTNSVDLPTHVGTIS
jgi:X-linked retinitis pigmentosa GTPase regulator